MTPATIIHIFIAPKRPACGIHPLAEARDPSGKPMAAINVRCLEGVDFASLPVNHFDGRSR